METPVAAPSSDLPKDAKSMAMLSHLLGIFFGFIPSLVIWLTKKQEHPFIEDQAKEALNFQITLALGWIAATIIATMTLGLGSLLFPLIWLCDLIFSILGAMKANEGIAYRYPFALRLVK